MLGPMNAVDVDPEIGIGNPAITGEVAESTVNDGDSQEAPQKVVSQPPKTIESIMWPYDIISCKKSI